EAVELLADIIDQADDDKEAINSQAEEVARVVRSLQVDPEMRSSEVEWQRYLTRALCILIPGLEQYEADMLKPQTRLDVVGELGYLRAPRAESDVSDDPAAPDQGQPAAEGGEPQSPPEVGLSSTGDEPEPVSVATTE